MSNMIWCVIIIKIENVSKNCLAYGLLDMNGDTHHHYYYYDYHIIVIIVINAMWALRRAFILNNNAHSIKRLVTLKHNFLTKCSIMSNQPNPSTDSRQTPVILAAFSYF